MIVDDDAVIRVAHSRLFKRSGYDVLLASSGNDALELLSHQPVDVVISDVRMPGGTGLDLLKGIKAKGILGLKVILASGFTDISNDQALQLGAVALIEKPIDRKKLLRLIEVPDPAGVPNKPGGWLELVRAIFFRTPLERNSLEHLRKRGRLWLADFGYMEVPGRQPVRLPFVLYGAELRPDGPHEVIVQIETMESLSSASYQRRFKEVFRWKMVRPKSRKIVIVAPLAAADRPALAFFDERVVR